MIIRQIVQVPGFARNNKNLLDLFNVFYSTIPEDEFFDAVETGLDKIEEDRQIRVKLKLQTQQSQIESGQIPESIIAEPDDFGTGKLAREHKLWPEIEQVCEDQLHHARQVSDVLLASKFKSKSKPILSGRQ
jgi:hypothetical protein